MPIYEYKCPRCEREFEELVLKRDDLVCCPECGSEDARKLMSRCRAQVAGASELGSAVPAGGGGCSSCGGGSCATCG